MKPPECDEYTLIDKFCQLIGFPWVNYGLTRTTRLGFYPLGSNPTALGGVYSRPIRDMYFSSRKPLPRYGVCQDEITRELELPGVYPQVVINARFLSRRITGVERYAREVTRRLGERVAQRAPAKGIQGLAGHLWEQVSLPASLSWKSVLWSPANTGPLRVANQVLTIHDLSPIDHPEWFKPAFAAWYRYFLPRLSRRVLKVIADSEFTRQRLAAACGLPVERVAVIPCGVDGKHFSPRPMEEVSAACHRYAISRPYFIAVGSFHARKNLEVLLLAWEHVIARCEDISLVLVGEPGGAFRNHGIPNLQPGVKWAGYVEENDLPKLYSGALGLVYPSIYEGFGLPVLEAMGSGTPVITSNSTAIPEVAGQAALLVDPGRVEEIALAMESLIASPELRRELSQKGLARARLFSWDRTAQSVWAVLEQACESVQSGERHP